MNHGVSDSQSAMDEMCINTIRTLSMDAVQKANSGHPGAPMGLAPAAYVLWTRFLKHNPQNPGWIDRDRFVLSGGHASALLYSLLCLSGYDVSLEDLRNFRQWGSKTPGHPEYGHTPGVETTTGPLGQGFANAVGMAMAERHLAKRFNRNDCAIVDHRTYVMCGDGDLMEGIASEAASLAGHLGLGRLICLYDDNRITIEGKTDITFTEDTALRFQSYNWHVQKVADGNDLSAIQAAIEAAAAQTNQPSIIFIRTHIAFGSPNKQDSSDAHGAPLGEEEVRLTKKNLGCPEEECFLVPNDVITAFHSCIEKGMAAEASWNRLRETYRAAYPDLSRAFDNAISGNLPDDWDLSLPAFSAGTSAATRSASGKILNALAVKIPELIGGSADLAPSNNTVISSSFDFQKESYDGRNIRFGVREHAMGAILSGMALHKGLIPYGGTFLVFADYMRPAIRMAALMKLQVIYILTHDSIAVGEDGPTHQPVEQIASLRIIPGVTVIRPADAAETVEAWKFAIQNKGGPTALILSRQNLPVLDRKLYAPASGLASGAYVLHDFNGNPELILIASGSEIHIALEAGEMLAEKGIAIRVVSMPSWELFDKTTQDYKNKVLLPAVKARIAIEAGHPIGWEKYVGCKGKVIGISRFGSSAPGNVVMKHYGFTAENIVHEAMTLLEE